MSSVGGSGDTGGSQSQASAEAQRSSAEAASRASEQAARASQAAPDERDLVDAAVNGTPVAAGQALATLDKQNGSRSVTDAQVQSARSTATVNGVHTATETQTNTRASVDGVEQTRDVHSVQTKTGVTGYSRTATQTQTQTTGSFDAAGQREVDRATGAPSETVQSRTETKASTQVGATGLNHTQSVSAQRGPANAAVSNTTTVDDKGIGTAGTASAGIGTAKGQIGTGLSYGSNGVTTSGTIGGTLGPLGAQHTVERQQSATAVKDTATTTATIATPAGKPVTASLEYKQTDVKEVKRNPDGSISYSVTGEIKATAAAAVDVRNVKLDGALATGQRTVHSVTVPKGVDVATIDVTKPAGWPAGTRVTMSEADFTGTQMGASIGVFGLKDSSESTVGRSISMEKKSDGRVSVTAGPTSAVSRDVSLGIGLAGFRAGLGNKSSLGVSDMRSYDVDVATPAGMKAFDDTVTARQAPNADTPGVSGMTTTETVEIDSAWGLSASSPIGAIEPGQQERTLQTTTRFADGRVEERLSYDANKDGFAELTATRRTLDGHTWSERTFSLNEKVTEATRETVSQLTNRADLKAGDTVSIGLTENQVRGLRAGDLHFGPSASDTTYSDRMNQLGFVSHLSRSVQGEGIIGTVGSRHFATQQNRPDFPSNIPADERLPGTVTISRP